MHEVLSLLKEEHPTIYAEPISDLYIIHILMRSPLSLHSFKPASLMTPIVFIWNPIKSSTVLYIYTHRTHQSLCPHVLLDLRETDQTGDRAWQTSLATDGGGWGGLATQSSCPGEGGGHQTSSHPCWPCQPSQSCHLQLGRERGRGRSE